MKNICIIGSGSWGSALAITLGLEGHNIKMWSFSEDEKDLINKEHKCKFLPNAVMPQNVYCTTSFEEAIQDTDIILHVTPSKFTRDTVKKYKQYVTNQPIVVCSKGFEKESLKTLDEVVKEELPDSEIAVLSGPSHAEEVSIDIPTALVVASENESLRDMLQAEFMNENLRIYTSEDVKGVELRRSFKKYYSVLCRSCSRNWAWR